MKVCIIYFSPTGNTEKVARLLLKKMQDLQMAVQLVSLSDQERIVKSQTWHQYLETMIEPHDLLVIGGPVYAHHLQYTVLDAIRNLPTVGGAYGRMAAVYVTYGGIDSGLGMHEGWKALEKTGRDVICAMKLSMTHHMTGAFMDDSINSDYSNDLINEAVDCFIESLQSGKGDYSGLPAFSIIERLIMNVIFNEKTWHRKRYPKLGIDEAICTQCGKCSMACPVGVYEIEAPYKRSEDNCIHCFNCIGKCPVKAVRPIGDNQKAVAFMKKALSHGLESPACGVYR